MSASGSKISYVHTLRSIKTRKSVAAALPVRLKPHSTCSWGYRGTGSTPAGLGIILSPIISKVSVLTGLPWPMPVCVECENYRGRMYECYTPTSNSHSIALYDQRVVLLDTVQGSQRQCRQAVHESWRMCGPKQLARCLSDYILVQEEIKQESQA